MNNSETESCSICLENIDKEFVKTPCSHVFHFLCLTEWFYTLDEKSTSRLCPICKTQIYNEEDHEISIEESNEEIQTLNQVTMELFLWLNFLGSFYIFFYESKFTETVLEHVTSTFMLTSIFLCLLYGLSFALLQLNWIIHFFIRELFYHSHEKIFYILDFIFDLICISLPIIVTYYINRNNEFNGYSQARVMMQCIISIFVANWLIKSYTITVGVQIGVTCFRFVIFLFAFLNYKDLHNDPFISI
jgi:hypothetical protein